MPGIDRVTGRPLGGIDHAFQSIGVIATTTRGSRVMRRTFGSILPRLVDRSLSPLTLIDFFAAIAEIVKEEPRVRLQRMRLVEEESNIPDGRPVFELEVLYYPRGHLGDYSEVESASGRVAMA